MAQLRGVARVALGKYHRCAQLASGRVRCWGANFHGQLGDSTALRRLTRLAVPGLGGIAELSLGYAHSCARLIDGGVRCWGFNRDGELGDGTTENRLTPAEVLFPDS